MKIKHIIALALYIIGFTAYGYAPQSFKPVPNIDDISNNSIVCMLQDSHGFMWFGTEHGLNRFDGYQVKTYLTDGQESKRIFSIDEDGDGNVWVVKGYGDYVVVYDRDTDAFVTAQEFFASKGLDVPEVVRTFVDEDGALWYSTTSTLERYDSKTNKLTSYSVPGAHDTYSMVKDNGQTYIATLGALLRLNNKASADTIYVADPQLRALIDSRAHISLYKDDNATVWLYAHESPMLWRNELYKPTFQPLPLPSSNFVINSVVDDHKGNIWIATNHEGAYKINKTSGLAENVIDKGAGTDGFYNINTLMVDNQGNVWGGGYTSGIRMLRDNDRAVQAYNIPGENVILLYLDSGYNLWVGVEGEGISIRHPNAFIDVDIPNCNVTAIGEDPQGRVWIGTYLHGLFCYDHGKITSYTTDNSKLHENSVFAIYAADNGHLWLGTLNNGLIRYTGENFTREFEELNSVSSIDCDPQGGKLYVGSDMGLGILDMKTGKSEILTSNRSGDVIFPSRHVGNLIRARDGKIWMGFAGGVVVWDPVTDDASLITTADGLPGNLVYSILEDPRGNIWVTTDRGAADITYLPEGSIVRRYGKADGLLSYKTSYRSLGLGSDGGLLIGSEGGFTYIDLNEADRQTVARPVTVTDVTVNREMLASNCITMPNDSTTHIVIPASLTRDGCSVTVNISDFNYLAIGKEQFSCKINGSGEWVPLSSGQIMFGQMRPGTYNVLIRRIEASGAVDPHLYRVKIVVKPQWWASTIAKIAYVLVAMLLLVGLALFVNKVRRSKARRELEIKEGRQLAEVNDLKMRFFTNVSHDLRTPLSLIITPLEELQKADLADGARKNVDIARRNADHLLSLVNQLLDFRRLDVNAEALNPSTSDIVAYVAEQFATFKDYSDNNRRNLRFHAGIDSVMMSFDREKLKRIIYNLLSNALKFTPIDGNITIDLWLDCDRLYIAVADDGVGVPDEMKERIFDAFCQVRSDDESITGSGIGLNIVKQYVEMHGGEIKVVDNKPRGSRFVFWMPVTEIEISEETPVDPSDSRPTILVVEDNADYRDFIADNLGTDFRVLRAENGRHAIEMVDTHDIDVIVTDVMMPEINGIELCSQIKNDPRWSHIPVIMMTARVGDDQRIEGLESGADDYITKPFSIDLLKLRINKFLEWRQRSIETSDTKIDVRPSDITFNHVDEEFVNSAIALVEANLANTEFSVEEMASRMSLSRTGLYRKISQLTGKTPLEFIQFLRLSHAKRMLEAGMNVSEVAYAVGYNQPKYFSKQFHDVFGCTPTEYKKSCNEG